MLWKNIKCYKQALSLPFGVQIYKFEADWMSNFQDVTYKYSIIGIFLNFFSSKVKLLFELKLF